MKASLGDSEEIREFYKQVESGTSTESVEWVTLCGHGVCINCQMSSGRAQCIFCPEHYVAENMTDEHIDKLSGGILYKKMIDEINLQKQTREYIFDWVNNVVSVYKG